MGSNNTTPNIFNFIDTGTARNITANVSWGHNFSTRVISNLRYNFSRSRSLLSPFFAYIAKMWRRNWASPAPRKPRRTGVRRTFRSPTTPGSATAASSLTRNQTSGVGESLIWVHGVHNMTFGADYRRQQINRASDPNARGQFTFTGASTANLVNGVAAAGTGFDFASFLLGLPDTSALRYGNGNLYFRTAAYDVYMTDDWRLSQKFSLNFGVRWDYGNPDHRVVQPPGESRRGARLRRDRAGAARTIRTVLRRAARFAGQAGQEQHFSAHRFRLAAHSQEDPWWCAAATALTTTLPCITPSPTTWRSSRPFAQTLSIASSPCNPLTLQNGFIIPASTQFTNTYAIDPNYRIGYAQMWQISVQQDLGHSLVGTITYNGTKGTGLDQTILPNSAPSGAKANGLPAGYIYEQANGNSIYHGVTFQLMRRFRNGVSANASYTYLQGHRQRGAGAELPGHFGRARRLQQAAGLTCST